MSGLGYGPAGPGPGPGANVEHACIARSHVAGSTPSGGPRTAAGPADSGTPLACRQYARFPCPAGEEGDGSVRVGAGFDVQPAISSAAASAAAMRARVIRRAW